MGTHPIFESDFDCLTEETKMEVKTDIERRLETEGTIRLGENFQVAQLPKLGDEDHQDESMCFWEPSKMDSEDYLQTATKSGIFYTFICSFVNRSFKLYQQ